MSPSSPQAFNTRVEGRSEAVHQFIARVLLQAHQAAEASDEPGDARAVLGVIELFADKMAAADPEFDSVAFIEAATEGVS